VRDQYNLANLVFCSGDPTELGHGVLLASKSGGDFRPGRLLVATKKLYNNPVR
jgi:hypothetical protein